MMELSNFDILFIVGSILYALYVYGTWNYGRFKNTKVNYPKPSPIVGNAGKLFMRMESMVENFGKIYTAFPSDSIVGLFHMRTPAILIRDPDLIRKIGIKDFDNFVNHRTFVDADLDTLFGNILIALKDQKWRDMRATMSPAFTGSKMRAMYSLVSECIQEMTEYLMKEAIEKGTNGLEMKDLFTRLANDVIATAAFGIKVNSLRDKENLFYVLGKRIADFSNWKVALKVFGFVLMPKAMKLFKINMFDAESANYFRELVQDTMKIREEKGIVRPDMIHLLMQARQGTLQHDNTNTTLTQQQDAGFATVTESDVGKVQTKRKAWSDDELIAQALIFFFAGFDTISTVLSFTCHELAITPEVQKRLQEEIDQVCEELGDDKMPDYERIHRMKYLDMVTSETLRMWPPLPFTDRMCINPYIMEYNDGNKFEVMKNELIFIPIYHIHRDEKYYSNPEKFDPERFSDENKKNIKPFTYLPFGVGPRNCIASRFALMEVKAILFKILRHFDIVPCEKTQIPIVLSKKSMQMQPENGFWMSFKPRIIK